MQMPRHPAVVSKREDLGVIEMRQTTGKTGMRVRAGKAWRIAFMALAFLAALGVPSGAITIQHSLNDLVSQSATIAVGTVTAMSYEVVDGHAWTKVTIAREAHPELGGTTGPIEFSVPGGFVGPDLIEKVTDTPSFEIGDRALVMLKPGTDGKMGVVGGTQGKVDVSENGMVNSSSATLQSLLANISAIRAGSAPSSIPVPESALTLDCCSYALDEIDHQPIRWDSPNPSISYKIYDNSGVTGARTEIQQAAGSWNSVACSSARLSYGGVASACGDNICCWADLGVSGPVARTSYTLTAAVPHMITAFQIQFNNRFTWSTNCAANTIDIETVALHELGHVLGLGDLTGTCSSYAMYSPIALGTCKHDPTLDGPCLTALYTSAPTLSTFDINNGATTTNSTTVTLNHTATCSPTYYMASESSLFSGASWITYSATPTFTLSSAPGSKTVYFKVKNATGTSSSRNDGITLLAAGPTAPSSPGATNVTTNSISWTWHDNSSTETGFKVYADPGVGPPTNIRTTTAAGATSWDYSPSPTGLDANTQYAFQVSATDGAIESTRTPNFAKYTLALAPTFGGSGDGKINCDKGSGGSTWYPASTNVTFTAVNGFGTGLTKASSYRYIWNTSAGEPSWSGASSWIVGTQALTGDGTRYLHIQSASGSGDYNTATLQLGPYNIDSAAPSAPVPVTDSGVYQADTTQLSASWAAASDSGSGVCEYQYAIGTSPTILVVGWTSAGTTLSATATGLTLAPGSVYYWYVRARDCAGNYGATASSDGITITGGPAVSIDAAKDLPNGTIVGLYSKTVTAICDNGFYAQDAPPWPGIRVDCAKPTGLAVGSIVDIVGATLVTSADGEKYVTGTAVLGTGTVTPYAVGLTNGSMRGAGRNYDAVTGSGQQGTEGGVGLNSIGMLVRTWGRLSSSGSGTVQSWNFDTDPGFTFEGSWAYGTPTGGGSSCHDPTTGYTGTKVVGYNLSGDYANGIVSPYYATTPAVNCSGYTGVHLSFYRWLGVERNNYDHASLQASNDGTTWTTLWSNPNSDLCDGAWVAQDFDISSVADGQATVYVRWGMGSTDSSVSYCGWNIDDVRIYGTSATYLMDDGSGFGLRTVFPTGMVPPSPGAYISATGICSCYKDLAGKVQPMLKVTGWQPQ
jgi:hypothetical protein